MITPSNENVVSLPHDTLTAEGESQKDRLLQEVMETLFLIIPDKKTTNPSFVLSDGTACFIKKFFAPRHNDDGEMIYGFDVEVDNSTISHLEFSVKCSGWERCLS